MDVFYRTLAELPHRLREQVRAWPARLRAEMHALRSEPAALWHSPILRVLLLVILGATTVALVNWLAAGLVPGGDRAAFQEPTRMATLYVACTNPNCLASFTTRQPMNFRSWPLTCPHCGQSTAYRARLCRNCGHWYATAPGASAECPWCTMHPAQTAQRPVSQPARNPDDEEDPW